MDVRAIRVGLADALASQGYRVYDTLPENGQLPLAAVSWPDEIRYHETLADSVVLDMTLTVAVALNDFDKAQRDIDAVMSTPGLGDEIEKYDTAAWRQAVVRSAGNVRQLNVGAQALACDFNLQILA